jgi:hypothetical protein
MYRHRVYSVAVEEQQLREALDRAWDRYQNADPESKNAAQECFKDALHRFATFVLNGQHGSKFMTHADVTATTA